MTKEEMKEELDKTYIHVYPDGKKSLVRFKEIRSYCLR